MRDPDRIARILYMIEIIWNRFPDQRLMQLLTNVIGPGIETVSELRLLEDDALENFLRTWPKPS
jgi:hypothetical protein